MQLAFFFFLYFFCISTDSQSLNFFSFFCFFLHFELPQGGNLRSAKFRNFPQLLARDFGEFVWDIHVEKVIGIAKILQNWQNQEFFGLVGAQNAQDLLKSPNFAFLAQKCEHLPTSGPGGLRF